MKTLIAVALSFAATGLLLAADAPAKPAPAMKKETPAAAPSAAPKSKALSDPALANEKATSLDRQIIDQDGDVFVQRRIFPGEPRIKPNRTDHGHRARNHCAEPVSKD